MVASFSENAKLPAALSSSPYLSSRIQNLRRADHRVIEDTQTKMIVTS